MRSFVRSTPRQVSDQVIASANDMIANASAIGCLLQEMGAGVADVSYVVVEFILAIGCLPQQEIDGRGSCRCELGVPFIVFSHPCVACSTLPVWLCRRNVTKIFAQCCYPLSLSLSPCITPKYLSVARSSKGLPAWYICISSQGEAFESIFLSATVSFVLLN